MIRAPFIGWLMISVGNMFLTKMLPELITRKLTNEEFAYYKKPYPNIASRKPVMMWPREVPIDGKPAHMHKIIDEYSKWVEGSDIPKICFYAEPGAIIQKKDVEYIKNNFKVDINVYHMEQEIISNFSVKETNTSTN